MPALRCAASLGALAALLLAPYACCYVRNLHHVRIAKGDDSSAYRQFQTRAIPFGLLLLDVLPEEPLFDEVLVYFPDPWRGSLERRMVRAEVTRALWERCRPGARLRLAPAAPPLLRRPRFSSGGGCGV